MLSARPSVIVDTGKCDRISAPAQYSGEREPGTLEMTTLIDGAKESELVSRVIARMARPNRMGGTRSLASRIRDAGTALWHCLADRIASRVRVRRVTWSGSSVGIGKAIALTWLPNRDPSDREPSQPPRT